MLDWLKRKVLRQQPEEKKSSTVKVWALMDGGIETGEFGNPLFYWSKEMLDRTFYGFTFPDQGRLIAYIPKPRKKLPKATETILRGMFGKDTVISVYPQDQAPNFTVNGVIDPFSLLVGKTGDQK